MILSTELKMLLWSSILGIIQLFLASHFKTLQRGLSWNLSPRDEKVSELTGVAGRLDRAFKNFMETFPFFIAAVTIVQITTMANSVSNTGALIYFFARVLYVPLYALGIPVVRSIVWLISLIGIMMVFSAVF